MAMASGARVRVNKLHVILQNLDIARSPDLRNATKVEVDDGVLLAIYTKSEGLDIDDEGYFIDWLETDLGVDV